MAPRKNTTRPRPQKPGPRPVDQGTRQRLLESAGHVFAEKGFDRATAKEIAQRARTNTAAVNYYYTSRDGLYAAVVREAHDRLVTVEALSAAVSDQTDAASRLEAFIGLFVRALTAPPSSSWVLRVLGREFLSPSPALDLLREKQLLPKAHLLRAIVSELMDLPGEHPAVARGCVHILAPCWLLLIGDRRTLKRAFPNVGFGPDDADALLRHMVRYALGGLSAVRDDSER